MSVIMLKFLMNMYDNVCYTGNDIGVIIKRYFAVFCGE